ACPHPTNCRTAPAAYTSAAQWHFPARPLKRPRSIATPGRRRSKTRDGLAATRGGSAAMVTMAIVVVMPAMVTRPRGPLAAHRHAAGLAELSGLGFHAGSNLRHVRNNIGTKPHGIGGACLADGVATLGGRAVDTTKQDGCQQYKRAGQVNDPHNVFPVVSD